MILLVIGDLCEVSRNSIAGQHIVRYALQLCIVEAGVGYSIGDGILYFFLLTEASWVPIDRHAGTNDLRYVEL